MTAAVSTGWLVAIFAGLWLVLLVYKYRKPGLRQRATRFLRNRVAVRLGLLTAVPCALSGLVDGYPFAALFSSVAWFVLVAGLVDVVHPVAEADDVD